MGLGWDKITGGAIQCSHCFMGGPLFLLQTWGRVIEIVVNISTESEIGVKYDSLILHNI